jgi:hypothetical protein
MRSLALARCSAPTSRNRDKVQRFRIVRAPAPAALHGSTGKRDLKCKHKTEVKTPLSPRDGKK